MGGSSGVLLAIFFAAAGDAASSGLSMRDALRPASPGCRRSAARELGDRTMVDALPPALASLASDGIGRAAEGCA